MFESKFRGTTTRKIQPAAQFLASIGVTANMVTLTGFALNVLAGICLGYGKLLAAGILVSVGGSLDFVDGAVARARPIKDRSGALLDSVTDRYSEVALFIGATVFFHLRGDTLGLVLVLVTMPGSLLVSYVRARAEGLEVECKVGIMQRPERIVLLAVGLVADSLLSAYLPRTNLVLIIVFGILAVATQWTALHRLIHTFRKLKRHPISD